MTTLHRCRRGMTPHLGRRVPEHVCAGGSGGRRWSIAAYIYASRLGKEKTDDAQVEAHVGNVAARITGQVKRVLVADNQEVQPGAVLVELDDRDQMVKNTDRGR